MKKTRQTLDKQPMEYKLKVHEMNNCAQMTYSGFDVQRHIGALARKRLITIRYYVQKKKDINSLNDYYTHCHCKNEHKSLSFSLRWAHRLHQTFQKKNSTE